MSSVPESHNCPIAENQVREEVSKRRRHTACRVRRSSVWCSLRHSNSHDEDRLNRTGTEAGGLDGSEVERRMIQRETVVPGKKDEQMVYATSNDASCQQAIWPGKG